MVNSIGQLALFLILIAGSGCASTRVTPRFIQADAVSPPPSSISVMTANLHRNTRHDDMRLFADNVRTDLAGNPDFILCQEVMFSPLGPNQSSAGALAKRLGYDWRGNPRGALSMEGSAILSRYPFLYYDALTLKSSPSRWKLGFRRMSVMGEFAVPGVGRVRVVNVHFQDCPIQSENRRAQLAETLQWTIDRDGVAPAVITFLGGDFNAEPTAPEFDALNSPESRMAFQNFNTNRLSKFDKQMRSCILRLDNIYVARVNGGPIILKSEDILWKEGMRDRDGSRRFVSDHLPMMHTYSLQSTSTPENAGEDER